MECEDLHSNFDSNFELFIVEEVVPHWEDMCVDNSAQRWLNGLICKQCHRCVAVQVDQKWKPVSQLLANKVRKNKPISWWKYIQFLTSHITIITFINRPENEWVKLVSPLHYMETTI